MECTRRSERLRRNTEFQMKKKMVLINITNLSTEVLVLIAVFVASRSLKDLFSFKITCRAFFSASEEDIVFKNVTMEKIPRFRYHKILTQKLFVRRCKICGNRDYIYRNAMKMFFLKKDSQFQALEILEQSAAEGHTMSMYGYSLLVLSNTAMYDENKRAALALHYMKMLRIIKEISRCRTEIGPFFIEIQWYGLTHYQPINMNLLCSSNMSSSHSKDNGKSTEVCERCLYDEELKWMYDQFFLQHYTG